MGYDLVAKVCDSTKLKYSDVVSKTANKTPTYFQPKLIEDTIKKLVYCPINKKVIPSEKN